MSRKTIKRVILSLFSAAALLASLAPAIVLTGVMGWTWGAPEAGRQPLRFMPSERDLDIERAAPSGL